MITLSSGTRVAASEVRYNTDLPHSTSSSRIPGLGGARLRARGPARRNRAPFSRRTRRATGGRPALGHHLPGQQDWLGCPRAVATAALADQFSRELTTDLSPQSLYALFRAGLPADLSAVFRTRPQDWLGCGRTPRRTGCSPPSSSRDPRRGGPLSQASPADGRSVVSPPPACRRCAICFRSRAWATAQQTQFADLYIANRKTRATMGCDRADARDADGSHLVHSTASSRR